MPLLPGDNCGQAVAINKHGDVAAYSSGGTGRAHFSGRGKAVSATWERSPVEVTVEHMI